MKWFYCAMRGKSTQFSAASDRSGLTNFGEVPEGRYRLCAAPDLFMFNPCIWGTAPVLLTANTETAQAAIWVSLGQGTLLKISVDDAVEFLAKNEAKTKDNFILIEAWNEQRERITLFETKVQAAKMRSYEAIVPKGTTFQLRVASQGFAIEDVVSKAPFDQAGRHLEVAVKDDVAEVNPIAKGLKVGMVQ